MGTLFFFKKEIQIQYRQCWIGYYRVFLLTRKKRERNLLMPAS